MIGSDFVPYEIQYVRYCSECNKKMPKGFMARASIKNGKIKKLLCSEDCRLTFDDRIWQDFARENKSMRESLRKGGKGS